MPLPCLSACANPGVPQASALGTTVNGSQQAQAVQFGSVLAIQPVLIAPNSTGIGTLGGAAAGGYLGSRIGNGNGNGSTALAIIGAVAGGIAGSAAEGAATREQGLQITVRLDDGQAVAVTQAADVQLAVGQRVEIIGNLDGGKARVLPMG
ncbi:outer membrane lipoprotein [Thiomonas sp.]